MRSLMNQAALMRHKTREMLVSQRTQLLNGLRGHSTEFGAIAPVMAASDGFPKNPLRDRPKKETTAA
jgi:transposase